MVMIQSDSGKVYVNDKDSYRILARNGVVTLDSKVVGTGHVQISYVSEVQNETKSV